MFRKRSSRIFCKNKRRRCKWVHTMGLSNIHPGLKHACKGSLCRQTDRQVKIAVVLKMEGSKKLPVNFAECDKFPSVYGCKQHKQSSSVKNGEVRTRPIQGSIWP
jgi:hypothetical protein